jgi:ribose/xylose/arabinose/galactoside ABC-type transport system permease subunit
MSELQNKAILDEKRFKIRMGSMTIGILAVVLFLVLSIFTDTFFAYRNIYSIFFGMSMQFFTVIGLTFLLVMGEVDLSVGSMYGLGGALTGLLVIKHRLPFLPSVLLTLSVALIFGLFIGFIVTRYRLNSMMVTLGTMMAIKGVNWVLINIISSGVFPTKIRKIVDVKLFEINWTVILMVLIVIVIQVLSSRSTLFKKMYMIGDNPRTARIYGVKSDRIKMVWFGVSSFTAAFGGIFAALRVGRSSVTLGEGLEFTVITAIILGGASLYGGKGSILGSAIGLLFLFIMKNGMVIFGIDPYYQQIVLGLILISSVYVDTKLNRNN